MSMDIVSRLRCVLKGDKTAQAGADEIERLRAELTRVTAQRDAILMQARIWSGEAKAQKSTVDAVGEILGGVPDWGPIAQGVEQLRAELAACRAAGEAAGYARGWKEAGRDAEAFRAAVRLGLCVNCYTSSDCMADGSAAVEIYASEIADSIHVKAIPDPYAAARSAVFAAANQIDALRGEVK